jgi:hypothetical protein
MLALACRPSTPTTPEACASLASDAEQDECYLTVLPSIFKLDPQRAVALTEQSVHDAATKDFIYLTVTRDIDPNSDKYCDRIVDARLKDRCRVLVSRPHLHRDLIHGQNAPLAPLGATGGAGGPPTMAPPRPPSPASAP